MDYIDSQILQLLQNNARMSFSDIGKTVALSTPAVSSRVQKLQEQGVIKGYTVSLDADALDKQLCCYCMIQIQSKQNNGNQLFSDFVQHEPDIWEAYCISGEYEYLLKIMTASAKTLEALLTNMRHKIPNVKTKSSIVLSPLKEAPFCIKLK